MCPSEFLHGCVHCIAFYVYANTFYSPLKHANLIFLLAFFCVRSCCCCCLLMIIITTFPCFTKPLKATMVGGCCVCILLSILSCCFVLGRFLQRRCCSLALFSLAPRHFNLPTEHLAVSYACIDVTATAEAAATAAFFMVFVGLSMQIYFCI